MRRLAAASPIVIVVIATMCRPAAAELPRSSAHAASRLPVRELPPPAPSTLMIRRREPGRAIVDPGAATPDRFRKRVRASAAPRGGENLAEKVTFRFNIGVGIDAGIPEGCTQPVGDCDPADTGTAELLSGAVLDENQFYERLRVYTFGDAVIGTRGLAVPGLTTYLAAQFRIDERFSQPSTAAPTTYDRSRDLLVRSGYAEIEEFFERPLLRPVYLRAGRMFHYGPAIAHFDGATAGYDGRFVRLAAYLGQRVDLFRTGAGAGKLVGGADAELDLTRLARVPVVVNAAFLGYDAHTHFRAAATYALGRDIQIGGQARFFDGNFARQGLSVRARISEVTTIYAEVDNRTSSDLVYDLFLADAAPRDATDPRRYLSLGPPLPRLQLNVRAGTVLLDNVDILVRAAGAFEHGGTEVSQTFSPSYGEAGVAAELRLRRALRLGASITGRGYMRAEDQAAPEIPGQPDPLPLQTGVFGERSFLEIGSQARYTAGARLFNAALETYVRIYQPQNLYDTPERFDGLDTRAGGLFRVEGWLTRRFRIKAEYQVSFTFLRSAPELKGLRSLRVLMEATF